MLRINLLRIDGKDLANLRAVMAYEKNRFAWTRWIRGNIEGRRSCGCTLAHCLCIEAN